MFVAVTLDKQHTFVAREESHDHTIELVAYHGAFPEVTEDVVAEFAFSSEEARDLMHAIGAALDKLAN